MLNPMLRGLAMNCIHGNRLGSSRTLSSLVVPLSTTKVSERSPFECWSIEARASAVIPQAFQLTRTMERSGAMRRLYAAAQLDTASDVVSRLLRGGAEDLMDNELDPKNEEVADTNDEAIKGRAKDEEG